MLSINREPKYKNKLLLSTLAVVAGFVVTVGIIRVVNPLVPSSGQSSQTTNDRRASSLIPIKASDSEKYSESDDSPGATGTSSQTTEQAPSSSPWVVPSTKNSSSTAPSPAANDTSSSSGTSTANPTPESGSEGNIIDSVLCTLPTLCP